MGCISPVFYGNGSLGQSLVTSTRVVRLAIREEPVDDHAQDREEEDKKRPEELVRRRAVGFDDFDEEDDVENHDD